TGKVARKIGLPSLIGFMIAGAIMGVSVLQIFNVEILEHLSFIPEIALGFVAFSIGSELNLSVLKRLGRSLTAILLCETLFTFALVTLGVLLISGGDWPMALIFGAMAPATAPAGTVAVLQEYKAKGTLTQALYAVVGFDDGIAVLIFGFAAALSKSLLSSETGGSANILATAGKPALEIVISIAAGLLIGIVYTRLVRLIRSHNNIPALTFGFVCVAVGLAITYGFSPILTPMAMGFVLSNTSRSESSIVSNRLRPLMPLIFILFFFIAGAHLNLGSLPSLGLLGLVYILARSAGKIIGAGFGARIGKAPSNIRKYLGIGILSQAGVAIGLSIAVAQQFSQLGARGSEIGIAVITTVTATCIIFEIIGPIMAKYALKKAGEIPDNS
ncbi:MAG: cation:proton antiporter, partial [Candidatus Fermentibacteraceae bacterium]|nr:cation:proton antiporter [Candidatus Fermentibacteraceae bacterium]